MTSRPEGDLMDFHKSTLSSVGGCVEVADAPGDLVAMRDTKDPDGPTLIFDGAAWDAFIARIKAGEVS
jgi:Domain of unknown function (DUF397)